MSLGRLRFGILTLLIEAICVVSAHASSPVMAPVPVQQEPHHRVMFENAQLRVIDVNIRPGETTLEHSHSNDILAVCVSASETRIGNRGLWGDIRPRRQLGETSLAEYAGQPGSHAIENVGGNLYRLIAVENLKQAAWSTESTVTAPGITVLNEARAFRTYAVRLQTASPVNRRHGVPTVVVLATGKVLVRSRTQPFQLDESTRWVLIDAGESYTLSAQGPGEARLVEIQVW